MARNTNRQGANFELEIMHYLAGCECEGSHKVPRHIGWRGFGYDCMRSSGSHGAVDVLAIGPLRESAGFFIQPHWVPTQQLFIQAKITNPVISPAERRKLQDWALRAGALPLVGYKLPDAVTGRVRPHFRQLTGPAAKDWLFWEPGEDN